LETNYANLCEKSGWRATHKKNRSTTTENGNKMAAAFTSRAVLPTCFDKNELFILRRSTISRLLSFITVFKKQRLIVEMNVACVLGRSRTLDPLVSLVSAAAT
jgi:hypothetical protein